MNSICLKSSTYKVVDIITKTKAIGWKDINIEDLIHFEFDLGIDITHKVKLMTIYNESQENSFTIRISQFNYMINHFKLKEVLC